MISAVTKSVLTAQTRASRQPNRASLGAELVWQVPWGKARLPLWLPSAQSTSLSDITVWQQCTFNICKRTLAALDLSRVT